MKKTIVSIVASLSFLAWPLFAQQPAVSPGEKAVANSDISASSPKKTDVKDLKNDTQEDRKSDARKSRREHRKAVNHRQRRKH